MQLVNLNLEVSRQLLDVPAEQRPLRFARIPDEFLGLDASPMFLHCIEMIFDPTFQQDPVRPALHKSLQRSPTPWGGRPINLRQEGQ